MRGSRIELGRVVGVFGVRGEVKLFLHHPASELWNTSRAYWLVAPDGQERHVWLTVRRGAGKRVLAQVQGVDDPEQAALLRDSRLEIESEFLPKPADDEFYVADAIGADVFIEGQRVGRLHDVHQTAGDDILVVDTGRSQVFVPCVRRWVVQIDVGAKRVELQPGALDEDAP